MSAIIYWRIRPALSCDAGHLSELAFNSKSYWGYSDRFMQACRKELTVDTDYIEKNPIFVIEADENIIGFYSLEHISAMEAELGYLFVEPRCIGKGYGRKLPLFCIDLREPQKKPKARSKRRQTATQRL